MTRARAKRGHNKNPKKTHSLRPWTAMLTHFFSGATFPAGVFLFVVAPFWSCSFPGRLFRPGPAVFCFFCCGPARTLGPGRRCLPPGWCFFCCCGPARTGVVFLFAVAPPGGSLTHCRLGRFRQGPGGVFFFGCGPAEPGEPIAKNVWCTTSGLKDPAGPQQKKKKTPLPGLVYLPAYGKNLLDLLTSLRRVIRTCPQRFAGSP